jgi:hypothetical protein
MDAQARLHTNGSAQASFRDYIKSQIFEKPFTHATNVTRKTSEVVETSEVFLVSIAYSKGRLKMRLFTLA